jgi:diguanylate cyclase (GGDEF)-like protein
MPVTTITVSTSPIVLIGCSNPGLTEFLAATLESWHYQIEVALNGTDALARIEGDNPPSIALLDMDLPGSAVEIVWEVRRRHEERHTWIILFSSPASNDQAGNDRARAALDCGGDDFLHVTADGADLKVRIRVAERILALTGRVQKQSAELRYHVTHDGLTGLWNREALISLIFQETDRVQRMKTPLSLMLLDLDDFSRVNHDYGYETGDRVLIELANRSRRQLRSYDLIGRCGEDEFLLALPGCNLENATLLADRIRESILARPFALDHDATTLTASFGVAISRGRSPLVVLREAERALAEAKLDGKNCVRGEAPGAAVGKTQTCHPGFSRPRRGLGVIRQRNTGAVRKLPRRCRCRCGPCHPRHFCALAVNLPREISSI